MFKNYGNIWEDREGKNARMYLVSTTTKTIWLYVFCTEKDNGAITRLGRAMTYTKKEIEKAENDAVMARGGEI